MQTLVTNGIRISVETKYQQNQSDALASRYIHSYRITISNESAHKVQLMKRHWFIVNSKGIIREVEGDGVIGKQPVLSPGESHQYVSWSPINTDMGKMYGYYTFNTIDSENTFKVQIPEFKLICPFKNN